MSKRDLARQKFVQDHHRRTKIKKSLKNQLILEREKLLDMEDGTAQLRRMTYKELVQDMNQDLKALEQIEKPVALYKEEKQEIAERMQKQDESLKKVKMVVWPIWTVVIIVNSLLLIAYNRQQVQI
jgi:hypothetical protein